MNLKEFFRLQSSLLQILVLWSQIWGNKYFLEMLKLTLEITPKLKKILILIVIREIYIALLK